MLVSFYRKGKLLLLNLKNGLYCYIYNLNI
jgi:hypothetical protein